MSSSPCDNPETQIWGYTSAKTISRGYKQRPERCSGQFISKFWLKITAMTRLHPWSYFWHPLDPKQRESLVNWIVVYLTRKNVQEPVSDPGPSAVADANFVINKRQPSPASLATLGAKHRMSTENIEFGGQRLLLNHVPIGLRRNQVFNNHIIIERGFYSESRQNYPFEVS